MSDFINGGIMMTYATIALFFWQFWKKSHDRFYVMFSAAFGILALNRLMPTVPSPDEGLPTHYVVRLIAFVLIVLAIIDKNYSR
jgi:hypothetical protein